MITLKTVLNFCTLFYIFVIKYQNISLTSHLTHNNVVYGDVRNKLKGLVQVGLQLPLILNGICAHCLKFSLTLFKGLTAVKGGVL